MILAGDSVSDKGPLVAYLIVQEDELELLLDTPLDPHCLRVYVVLVSTLGEITSRGTASRFFWSSRTLQSAS